MNQWAAQLQHIGGWDAQLVASLYGFKLANGPGYYDLSAAIKKITATTTSSTGQVTIKLTYGGTDHSYSIKEYYANPWTTISGSLNLSWTGTLTAAVFYIETPGNTWAIEVDNCSLVKVN